MNLQELEQRINKNKQNIDFAALNQELKDLESKLQTPEVWSNQNLASELGQKSREIKETLEMFSRWENIIEDAKTAQEIGDEELLKESENALHKIEKELHVIYEITFEQPLWFFQDTVKPFHSYLLPEYWSTLKRPGFEIYRGT